MSKVQEKEATLLSNLSGSEIANELDSRLRDLEKNIAVAREFIKLADESYSELRHNWNLLHEEVRNKSETSRTGPAIVADEKRETRPRNKKQSKTRETEVTELNKPVNPWKSPWRRILRASTMFGVLIRVLNARGSSWRNSSHSVIRIQHSAPLRQDLESVASSTC